MGNIKKLELKTPLVIASGPGGFGEYLKIKSINWNYVGAYTIKTITYKEKEGNKPPRMYAKDGFLINSIGLENPGAAKFIKCLESNDNEELSNLLLNLFKTTPVILSLGADSYEEYLEISKMVKPHLDRFIAVEYNFSCPNVKHGGLSIISNVDEWKKLIKEIRKQLDNTFLIAKLGIEGGFVENNAQIVQNAGWNGVTVVNTIRGLMFNDEGKIILGGLSGPNLMPIALRAVYEVRKKLKDIYIIASGGIYTPKDAKTFLEIGADAVSIGSALFKNEQVVNEIGEYLMQFSQF